MDEWLHEHVNELKRRLLIIVAVLAAASVFAFSVGFSAQEVSGVQVPVPELTVYDSVSAMLFQKIKADLVPPDVELIVTRPADAVLLQVSLSVFIGFVVALPVVVHQVWGFLSPGLTRREKHVIFRASVSWLPLFAAGAAFSYAVIMPTMLQVLYGYATSIDVLPFLNIDDFMTFTVQMLIAFGFIFTLPTMMAAATMLGVEPGVWTRNWRYALGGMLIFGALITPDGSLLSLALVAGPMLALYVVGSVVSLAIHRGRRDGKV